MSLERASSPLGADRIDWSVRARRETAATNSAALAKSQAARAANIRLEPAVEVDTLGKGDVL